MKVKLQMHASVSEICLSLQLSVKVQRMYVLFQKSRLKMGPVDTSGQHEYALLSLKPTRQSVLERELMLCGA